MRTSILGFLAASVVACGATPGAEPHPAGREVQMVSAVVRMNGCTALGPVNARLAEKTMNQLVEGCSTVPGGHVAILATLLPSGQIQLAAPAGQPEMVPLCVLKHALTHKLSLKQACQLEVTLEQSGVEVPGAPDASAD